jgi:alkyl hydroperoxide reductase subunit D
MNTLDAIRDALPEYARDLRLNLSSALAPPGAPGLTVAQIWAVSLAAAAASGNSPFTAEIESLAAAHLDAAHRQAAHAAAAVMAMNNVYYRFAHRVEDAEYATLPIRLRMNVIGSPGIARADFELLSLAVSAINGCGASHERQVLERGMGREAVQSAVRIAATVHVVARVLKSTQAAATARDARRVARPPPARGRWGTGVQNMNGISIRVRVL